MDAEERHGFEGDGFTYLRSPIWWGGIVACMYELAYAGKLSNMMEIVIVGEIANFAAYAFAPAILVTPLGALSVLIGAVLGSYFLDEKLGTLGKLGCAICLIGSVIIVLHAPPDKEIKRIDEILHYAIQPGKPNTLSLVGEDANTCRVSFILPLRCNFCSRYDIQSRSKVWQEESTCVLVDLFNCRRCFSHVSQGIWNCSKVDIGW